MLPFLSTATVMFSGFVCVGMFTAFGRSTFTVLLITGIVMRKMMSSTNMTPTRGVVLMLAIAACSSPAPDPTPNAIIVAPERFPRYPRGTDRARREARHQQLNIPEPQLLANRGSRSSARTRTTHLVPGHANAGAAYEVGMQVAREVPQGILQDLI